MSDLKNQLIRLGETNPELRDHLRPVIATLNKTALNLKADSNHQIYLWIGGPMNRDHRIGDLIPEDAEWKITHEGRETTITTKGLKELRSKVEKAVGMKMGDQDWKAVVTLIKRGDTAKVRIQLPSVKVWS